MVPFYMETRTANQQVAALYKREWRVVYFNVSWYIGIGIIVMLW